MNDDNKSNNDYNVSNNEMIELDETSDVSDDKSQDDTKNTLFVSLKHPVFARKAKCHDKKKMAEVTISPKVNGTRYVCLVYEDQSCRLIASQYIDSTHINSDHLLFALDCELLSLFPCDIDNVSRNLLIIFDVITRPLEQLEMKDQSKSWGYQKSYYYLSTLWKLIMLGKILYDGYCKACGRNVFDGGDDIKCHHNRKKCNFGLNLKHPMFRCALIKYPAPLHPCHFGKIQYTLGEEFVENSQNNSKDLMKFYDGVIIENLSCYDYEDDEICEKLKWGQFLTLDILVLPVPDAGKGIQGYLVKSLANEKEIEIYDTINDEDVDRVAREYVISLDAGKGIVGTKHLICGVPLSFIKGPAIIECHFSDVNSCWVYDRIRHDKEIPNENFHEDYILEFHREKTCFDDYLELLWQKQNRFHFAPCWPNVPAKNFFRIALSTSRDVCDDWTNLADRFTVCDYPYSRDESKLSDRSMFSYHNNLKLFFYEYFKDKSVIDIGSGHFRIASLWCHMFTRVVAVEKDETCISQLLHRSTLDGSKELPIANETIKIVVKCACDKSTGLAIADCLKWGRGETSDRTKAAACFSFFSMQGVINSPQDLRQFARNIYPNLLSDGVIIAFMLDGNGMSEGVPYNLTFRDEIDKSFFELNVIPHSKSWVGKKCLFYSSTYGKNITENCAMNLLDKDHPLHVEMSKCGFKLSRVFPLSHFKPLILEKNDETNMSDTAMKISSFYKCVIWKKIPIDASDFTIENSDDVENKDEISKCSYEPAHCDDASLLFKMLFPQLTVTLLADVVGDILSFLDIRSHFRLAQVNKQTLRLYIVGLSTRSMWICVI